MPTDFMDQAYDVGDTVCYAAMSGRCVAMVVGKVVKILDDGRVQIRGEGGSRWRGGEVKHRAFVDTRTGKKCNPYYTNPKTGELRPEFWKRQSGYVDFDGNPAPPYPRRPENPYDSRAHREWSVAIKEWQAGNYVWKRGLMADFVEEISVDPPPATINVTENILLIRKADQ